MGGPQAASVLSTVKQTQLKSAGEPEMTPQQVAEFEKPTLDKYEEEGSPYFSSSRIWDDGIIQIEDTRRVLAQALRIVSKGLGQAGGTGYGVFRT